MSSKHQLVTHKYFESIVPGVNNADTMYEYVGYALSFSDTLDKKTTPWEKATWGEGKLEKFEIDLEKVDRLYHIHFDYDNNRDALEYAFLGRMEYKGQFLYVKLKASYDYFDYKSEGEIFVSRNADICLNGSTTITSSQADRIRQSLVEDGIELDDDDKPLVYAKYVRMFGSDSDDDDDG